MFAVQLLRYTGKAIHTKLTLLKPKGHFRKLTSESQKIKLNSYAY